MSHYVFSFISFSFICNVWMFYIYIYIKHTEKWGKGVNCEEEMREKKEMGEGMYVCGGGEEKRKAGGTWVVGKKKRKKKKGEWGLCVWWEKGGSGKERRKKI
jgi:hypothetical protein